MKGWWKTRDGSIAQILFDHVDNGKYATGYIYIPSLGRKMIRVFTVWDKLSLNHLMQREYDLVSSKRSTEYWPEIEIIENQ